MTKVFNTALEYDRKYGARNEDILLYGRLLRDWGTKTVLEFFCGTGRIAIPLSTYGLRVSAIDHCNEMVEYLKKNAAQNNIKILAKKADCREFRTKIKYDAIIIGGLSLHLMQSLTDIERVLSSAFLGLNEGGRLILDLIHRTDKEVSFLKMDERIKKPINYFIPNEIIKLLDQRGFDVKKTYGNYGKKHFHPSDRILVITASKKKT